ncbi:MAG: gamma-glutamylcyclotransferase [Desulfovibrio sp.]|nr:gamma-glutamylcyclotransferase [Desulfovibrio sp.]
MEIAYYFAYGSNLNLSDLAEWCAREDRELTLDETAAKIAFLPDYYLAFTRYAKSREGGVLDVVKGNGHGVWGVIFPVTESALETLDIKEGASFEAYQRVTVNVMLQDGTFIEAVTYEVVQKEDYVEPSRDYFNAVAKGYEHFHLPIKQLDDARSQTQELFPLFAYGTLRRGFSRHAVMQENHAQFIGTGSIEAQLYDTGCGYPCVVPGTGKTLGELYTINSCNLMDELDQIEGYRKNEASLFKRRLVNVSVFQNDDKNPLWAWVFYSEGRKGECLDAVSWPIEGSLNDFCLTWIESLRNDIKHHSWKKALGYIQSSWYASDIIITDSKNKTNDLDLYYGKKYIYINNVKPIIWLINVMHFILREIFGQSDTLRFALGTIGERFSEITESTKEQEKRLEMLISYVEEFLKNAI